MKEERTTAENKTLRNHTVQIEQLEAEVRLKDETQERAMKEQRMKHKKEIDQMKQTTRLEKEGQERNKEE